MTIDILILGVFVADTTFRAARMPRMGETLLGDAFALGPGGKGSNQAVAAARAGGRAGFITRLGQDTFAEMGEAIWKEAGVISLASRHADSYTGAAFVFVDRDTGDNAIIISPGVASTISAEDVMAHAQAFRAAKVFITQLEQPIDAARRGLELAREAGIITILNPAPATELDDDLLALCDYVTPNETEAEALTGIAVRSPQDAEKAAAALIARGAGAAIITLGENGAFFLDATAAHHVPAIKAGPVVETTGAGDAFNGGFAAALAEGMEPETAVRFANATAALSVTRPGTAQSMPLRRDIDALLAKS